MAAAILWHRTCEILHLREDERGAGWPNSFNIERIARLHYPDDRAMERALLSLMKTAVVNGELRSNGTEYVIDGASYRGSGEFDRILALHAGQRPRPNQVQTWGHDVPTVTKDSYEPWQGRPPFPENSPLRGWVSVEAVDFESDLSLGRAEREKRKAFSQASESQTAERKPEWER